MKKKARRLPSKKVRSLNSKRLKAMQKHRNQQMPLLPLKMLVTMPTKSARTAMKTTRLPRRRSLLLKRLKARRMLQLTTTVIRRKLLIRMATKRKRHQRQKRIKLQLNATMFRARVMLLPSNLLRKKRVRLKKVEMFNKTQLKTIPQPLRKKPPLNPTTS